MILVITEKPSVAAEIAKVIGARKKGSGYFMNEEYYVSWCVGHLIETEMPEAYNEAYQKWRIADLPIMPDPWKYKVTEGTQTQYQVVKGLMDKAEVAQLICATDAGREGELIFRLVYQQAGCRKPFRRLWISSMETRAIQEGFQKLKDGSNYDRLYAAALARLQADWLVGINFSRLFGCLAHKPYNVGRVQTPTINLIVERQKAIDQFQGQPYYILTADFGSFTAGKRVESQEACQAVLEKCQGKNGEVQSLTQAPVKENPPALYDLTTLQREANKSLGLSAQQTLDIAQSLYEKKLITYPRTDSRYLSADMEHSTLQVIQKILNTAMVSAKTQSIYDLQAVDLKRVINDKKVTDHHAIIPTVEVGDTGQLSVEAHNVLMMITYRLLTAVYLPYHFVKTELILTIEGEEFKASGRQITQPGFKDVQGQMAEMLNLEQLRPAKSGKKKAKPAFEESDEGREEDSDAEEKASHLLPPLAIGQYLEVNSLNAKEKTTQPPKPYTEDTLLAAMEHAMKTLDDEALRKELAGTGLGTPATRAGIIERIIKTQFVQRKGKQLLPTDKAFELVSIVPEKVKSAQLTAEWEQKLEQIYQGGLDSQQFIAGIEDYVRDLVNEYKSKVDEQGKEIIGKCPRCGKNIYEGKVNYYCAGGRECNFTIWKNDSFFVKRRKPLTKPMVQAFLAKGYIKAAGLFSEKTGQTYTAYIRLEDTGKYVNFRLCFPK